MRETLGFNGMIVTDATSMLGYTCAMERSKAVPTTIAIGCDMFLFNKSFDEDYGYMLEGYKKGILTPERLQEALTRILALKGFPWTSQKAEGRNFSSGTRSFVRFKKSSVCPVVLRLCG